MKGTLAAAALCTAAFWGCNNNPKPSNNTKATLERLPQDVKISCTIAPDSFKKWFAGDTIIPNGFVKPANSVTFQPNNNCSFYQWSEQMFLWVTSPSPTGPGRVMESSVFYDVTPADSTNHRYFVPHAPGTTLRVAAHVNKTGPNRLPVLIDNKGRLFEIEKATAAKSVVKDAKGKLVAVDHVENGANGMHLFKDAANKVIDHPMGLIKHKVNKGRIVQELKMGKKSVYLDAAGNEVMSEAGQATGDVLRAQNGSLVYYLLMVNDVYAQFYTACNNGQMSKAQFPTTAGARDSICYYARQNSGPTTVLPDSNALAMEFKTSWIEAAGLPDSDSYITVMAIIPTYDTSNPARWVPNGEKKVKLAMIGMHVVGSVNGHPEMAWATFEHQKNAPMAKYRYIDSTGATKTVNQEAGTGWTLSNNTTDSNYNISHMQNSGDTIVADSGFTITASNTLITTPWGSAIDSVTNPEDGSSAASNSEIIAINNAVRGMLATGDIRKNYLLVGCTWTAGGAGPNQLSYGYDTTAGVAIGTSVLANSTMETYIQFPGNSCFTCHAGFTNAVVTPDTISHIFAQMTPLPSAPAALKK